ncbi:MAG: phage portal protein [Gaiellales bacterium]
MGLLDIFTGQAKPATKAQHVYPWVAPSSAASLQTLLQLGLNRETALSIPSAAACRNLIVNTIAQLGIDKYRGADRLPAGLLLTQPDPSCTWTQTIAQTVDDLIWYGKSAWIILARDGIATDINPLGRAVRARRVCGANVEAIYSDNLTDYLNIRGYYINGTRVDAADVIYFDAGHDGILSYGARTLAAAIDLEDAARRFATVELPAGILQNVGHELGPDEAADVVSAFQAARRENAIAFLQNVEYSRADLNPHDLQLVEARAHADTAIARMFGVPVTMIGASPTGNSSSLLYANVSQNMAQFVQTACAPYINTIERTLSLDSVIATGQQIRFDVQAFLRTDPEAATAYATTLQAAGVISVDEARGYLGIPATTTTPDLTPGRI